MEAGSAAESSDMIGWGPLMPPLDVDRLATVFFATKFHVQVVSKPDEDVSPLLVPKKMTGIELTG